MTLPCRGWVCARLSVLALGLALLSCSPSSTGAGGSSGNGTYTLIEGSAFNGFCSWSSAEAVAEGDASDGIHNVGQVADASVAVPLRVYWKEAPAHGSTAFPQGMLILKSTEEADLTKRTIFAMAKVGGGYNAQNGGAVNWEWYSLQATADCTVTTLWNAPQPPATESYAGTPIGDCNGCHTLAKDNDYVWDTALQLSNF